jgi:hypothetical protein
MIFLFILAKDIVNHSNPRNRKSFIRVYLPTLICHSEVVIDTSIVMNQ